MNWIRFLALMAALAATVVQAEETPQHPIVSPGQVIVQVKGVVCSFCAYGTEKNLSKLPFLDKAQFGDGVLMDIHANRITLALDPSQPLNVHGIHQAITKGGYDPLTVHLRLSGKVTQQGERYVLTAAQTGQVFELSGQGFEQLSDRQVVDIQAHLDASRIPALPEDGPIAVVVDRLDVRS